MKIQIRSFSFEADLDTPGFIVPCVCLIALTGITLMVCSSRSTDREAIRAGLVQQVSAGSTGAIWVKPTTEAAK